MIKNYKFRWFAGLLLCWLCGCNTFAQKFHFRKFSLQEGLPQSDVSTIFEDSKGYLWIGTYGGGLSRFNGKDFENFFEEQGLSDFSIRCIVESSTHEIMVATQYKGFYIFDGKTFRKLNHESKDFHVSSMVLANDSILIFGKEKGGLFAFHLGRKKTICLSEHITVSNLHKGLNENIWISSKEGLYLYKKGKLSEQIASGNFNTTVSNADFLYTLKDHHEIYVYRISKDMVLAKPERMSHPVKFIQSMYLSPTKQLFLIAQEQQVFCKNNTEWVEFNTHNGLPEHNVSCILVDRNGSYWFGTRGGGILRFNGDLFYSFPDVEGLRKGNIFIIRQDFSGNIWMVSSDGKLFRYDGTESVLLNKNSPFSGMKVVDILPEKKQVLIGDTINIYAFTENNHHLIRIAPLPFGIKAYRFFKDKEDALWLATRNKGLFKLVKQKLERVFPDVLKDEIPLFDINQAITGELWIGSNNGAFCIKNGKATRVAKGFCNEFVGSIAADKHGNMYFGTDACVIKYSDGLFRTIDRSQGLLASTVYSVVVDSDENLWVGTNKGVDKVIFNRDGTISDVKNYGYKDGFIGIECNSRSVLCDNEGNLWFGTVGGVIKSNPKPGFHPPVIQPNIRITAIREYFDTVNWKRKGYKTDHLFGVPINPEFPASANHLVIDFEAVDLSTVTPVQYTYRVLGLFEDWCPPTTNKYAVLTHLPAGSYEFQVKRIYPGSQRGKQAFASFRFSKKPYFYQQLWFYVLILFLVSSFVYLVNKIKVTRNRRERLKLERMVNERTSELKKASDEKEVLIKEIHHRVKNNLQVINSLISIQSSAIKDKQALLVFEECKNRIRSISLIHESLYQSDEFKEIDIEEYIRKLLDDLVSVHNISKRVHLELQIQTRLFNLNTLVPLGLILNEIISNSLKYAFKQMNEGTIKVKLSTINENRFELIIGDNGCGFNPVEAMEKRTLGINLMQILAGQLDGTVEKLDQSGTWYKIEFSAD